MYKSRAITVVCIDNNPSVISVYDIKLRKSEKNLESYLKGVRNSEINVTLLSANVLFTFNQLLIFFSVWCASHFH